MIYTFGQFFGESDLPRIAVSTSFHTRRVEAHSHTFYELVYVLAGFTLHFCGGHAALLTPGDLFLVPPGVEHSYVNAYHNGVLNFMFCPEDFVGCLDGAESLPGLSALTDGEASADVSRLAFLHVDIADRRSIENTFEKIRAERRDRPEGWQASLRARMTLLLLKYARLYAAQESGRSVPGGGYSYVLQILEYVENHYTEEIRMEQLSALVGLNTDYMSRRFKEQLGMSPTEYIRKFRVARAMELLCTTTLRVTEIAEMSGFSDVCQFSRVFRQVAGVTPLEFRRSGAPI